MDFMKKVNNLENNKNLIENKDDELARFGHTVTLVCNDKPVLFGGAKGSSSTYTLMNDVYAFDSKNKTWIETVVTGDVPNARAAHAAASSGDGRMLVFGGSVGGDPSQMPNELHLLDMNKASWETIKVSGVKPEGRYGHTMVYVKPFFLVFGGYLSTGKVTNDVWIINISEERPTWEKVKFECEAPAPRVYHAAVVLTHGRTSGMISVFGGRSDSQTPLNDLWGLRQHRNKKWSWVRPTFEDYTPVSRFQHSMLAFQNLILLFGGRSMLDTKQSKMPIEVFDSATSTWYKLPDFNKFRQAAWINNMSIYMHGGFYYSNPSIPSNNVELSDITKLLQTNPLLLKTLNNLTQNLHKIEKKEETQVRQRSSARNNNENKNTQGLIPAPKAPIPVSPNEAEPLLHHFQSKIRIGDTEISRLESDPKDRNTQFVYIDKKRRTALEVKTNTIDIFIEKLLRPDKWKNILDSDKKDFPFKISQILEITKKATEVVSNQPILLKVNTPVKVFGDIHGQYQDLMRFFQMWGEPKEGVNGDIVATDYLFLGDFVDRGAFSLETICLLMALKVKYPDKIHLLRGNHEDPLINSGMGFLKECAERLNENPYNDSSVFTCINRFFEYLPLAAVVDDQILCMHGGIGANFRKLSDIEFIQRPLVIEHEATTLCQRLLMDILWSDPTDNDDVLGIQPNFERDSENRGIIVKYGPDVVASFLKENGLSFIMRAHECVLDGFERFANSKLFTIFSATDYCRRHGNAGAMLLIKSNLEIIPHLIYPPEGGNNYWKDNDNNDDGRKARSPTPPRIRNNKGNF